MGEYYNEYGYLLLVVCCCCCLLLSVYLPTHSNSLVSTEENGIAANARYDWMVLEEMCDTFNVR
jgi:hypothetical protein